MGPASFAWLNQLTMHATMAFRLGRVDLKKGGGAELKLQSTELFTNDRITLPERWSSAQDLVGAAGLKIEGDALDLFPAFDPLLGQLFQGRQRLAADETDQHLTGVVSDAQPQVPQSLGLAEVVVGIQATVSRSCFSGSTRASRRGSSTGQRERLTMRWVPRRK